MGRGKRSGQLEGREKRRRKVAVWPIGLGELGSRWALPPLLPLLRRAGAAGRLRGTLYQGLWSDVGTPERLRDLDDRLAGGALG